MRFRKKNSPKGNYAFIDSQNLNLGVQKVGWKMDWKNFREFLRKNYNVDKAFMFIGYMAEHEKMYEQLHESGYSIVLKPTVGMFDEVDETEKNNKDDQKRVVKGNVDAELVLYAMKEMPNYHKAVIVSGDGDFQCLVEYLEERKRLLKILTPNWQYSSLLKPYERFIERIDQHRRELEHRDYRRKPKRK